MTQNLLLWKWSDEYDTPSRRKRLKIKFSDITADFLRNGDHPAIGDADIDGFSAAIDEAFGLAVDRGFVLEVHARCVVANYPNQARFELVPQIAAVGRRFGLNASEF